MNICLTKQASPSFQLSILKGHPYFDCAFGQSSDHGAMSTFDFPPWSSDYPNAQLSYVHASLRNTRHARVPQGLLLSTFRNDLSRRVASQDYIGSPLNLRLALMLQPS